MVYNNKVLLKGFFWSGLDKGGFVVLQLIMELVLARLLLPKDYGVIGIVLVFISLAITLSEGGFSNALIHKQDRTETDFSTVFYINIGIAAFLYLVIFVTAPYIEAVFGIADLALILRIVSLSIIFNASILVHKAKLSIAMDFKLQAKLSVLAVAVSGCLGIMLAYRGWGVWALVWQNLSMALLNALFFWVGYRWLPQNVFSFEALKKLFSFGSKIMLSAVIQAFYFNAYPLFIGRVLGTGNLGLYSKSTQFTQMPSNVMTTIAQRVLFPFFATHQNDDQKIFELNQLYTTICCIIFFPFFFIMATVAEPLVLLLFSETWIKMAPLFILLCLAYSFYPLIVNNMMMFQIKNKTGLFLKIEILTKIIGVAILVLTLKHGIIAVGYGLLVQQLIQFLITSYFVQTVLRKDILAQLRVILPFAVFAVLLFLGVRSAGLMLELGFLSKLFSGIIISVIAYGLFYLMFYRSVFHQLISMIKK
jgi:O-antigen/teichoic acid export membrane protein